MSLHTWWRKLQKRRWRRPTWCTDKGGRWIFEGDVLGSLTSRYLVEWNGEEFIVVELENPVGFKTTDGYYTSMQGWNEKNFAVIGNRYENPELMQ